ncbi:MAG: ketoacyl-ACP synthase III [Gammaproteobacteria bacterium]|nr:ketoacyl-ACP synthase III [Gammaproteobacteria bacterium]NNJ72817.1 ketoacyl-ACP synthase III [Enterobacterales bacterium]
MSYANITGWGKALPPAVLRNSDLATFLDTDDEWIVSRTGMKERRISHVPVSELAYVACAKALACAGKTAEDVEMIIFGGCTFDEIVPNAASNVQRLLGAENAACIDLNTACTSGMYSLSVATAMIKSGVVKNALVIGAETIAPLLDWSNRNVAVLFGDGAAALFLEEDQNESGVIAESLGCYGNARDILVIGGWGCKYATSTRRIVDVDWHFQGQDIFKQAVQGMSHASQTILEKTGVTSDQIAWVIPHQANLRIINTLAKRMKIPPEKVYINIERYGNMSAATALIALVEAIEEDKIEPDNLIMMPAFGGGLTWSSHLLKWGQRTTPLATTDVEVPASEKTGLELVQEFREKQKQIA